MTSHTLASFKPDNLTSMSGPCAFCKIGAGEAPAHVVYEDEENLAFLDILPLRRGHTLVVPKAHVAQVSELSPDQAASLAKAVVNVTRAVGKGALLSQSLVPDRLTDGPGLCSIERRPASGCHQPNLRPNRSSCEFLLNRTPSVFTIQ